MLWWRAAVFSLLVPAVLAVYVPWALGPRRLASGYWQIGWILVVGGAVVYLWCLASFLAAGGTPAIFFTRRLRALMGEEPRSLVRGSLYRYSRNPMYVGVVGTVMGEALIYASFRVGLYGLMLFCCFYVIVVWVEEPHLRARDGKSYEQYCAASPRWLGRV